MDSLQRCGGRRGEAGGVWGLWLPASRRCCNFLRAFGVSLAYRRVCNPLRSGIERRLMPRITYIEYNGDQHEVEVMEGVSVMEGAVKNGVPGIDADCGGACACATCHVFVDPAWHDVVGKPADDEKEMLEFAKDGNEFSRLSCQIMVSDALDGLVVRMPESQQ